MTSQKYHTVSCVREKRGNMDWDRFAAELGVSQRKTKGITRTSFQIGWVDSAGCVTKSGRSVLAPYKVENAVIMAAGMSSRFAPLSYEKPKGLLVVRGEVLIERQIRQLQEVGITDITVVVGYMKEKFFYLREKFGVDIVVNEDYHRYNNTSTLIRVLHKLGNTYICSSDNYFTENVFEPYVCRAYYAATYFPGPANEWGLKTDRKNRIVGIDHAPVDKWCMMGHVYFDREFSETFKKLLVAQYGAMDVRQNLWEHLFEKNIKSLVMYKREYSSEVIKEFDSLEELRAFDNRYLDNTGSRIFKNICKTLKCNDGDIDDIEVIKQGMTNLSFAFSVAGKRYVYRHPGIGTEAYISRKSEAYSLSVAKRLNLDSTVIKIDPKTGWKISTYIDQARTLDYHNKSDVAKAIRMMRKLHDARLKSHYSFDIWKKSLAFVRKTNATHKDLEGSADLKRSMASLYRMVKKDGSKSILCHCDCYAPNFLLDRKGRMTLIDWEYSGAADPGVDIGTFICCSDYSESETDKVLAMYHGHEPTNLERRHDYAFIAIAAYYWFVWAIYQESIGSTVGNYLSLWYDMAKRYLNKAVPLYRK